MTRAHRLAAPIGLVLLLAGCATNPVTGERQFTLISEAQEIEMGRAAAEQARATIGVVDDAELQAYVQRVGLDLARDSERPKLPWSFAVVDDPTPNAFALPGGFIFVTRGMMNLMESEAELASVLGHEIGHVTARHSVTAMSQQQLAQLGLGIGGIIFPEVQPFGQAIGAGLELLFLKHGRDAERQADELGFSYSLAHGYSVEEMADVFLSLQRIGDEQRSALPSWLMTHPAPAERITAIEKRAAALPQAQRGAVVRRAEYLQRIDGLVYGDNPRNGFFREGVFYHPDLRFQFALPGGWSGQNLTAAVVAVSPRRDAAVELTLAGDGNAGDAARRFLSQQGIQPLRTSTESINGLAAVVSVFDAATQQGTVRGLSAHIPYGGRTYQIVGYTPAGAFQAYGPELERIIGSFAALRDPEILSIQPNRMDIVRLDRSTTLAEFTERYRSAVPAPELAVLNQVADPRATLPAGSLVKRVVAS
jgi:predicted Zn-dependent protease